MRSSSNTITVLNEDQKALQKYEMKSGSGQTLGSQLGSLRIKILTNRTGHLIILTLLGLSPCFSVPVWFTLEPDGPLFWVGPRTRNNVLFKNRW